jgi:hypothetical protein
MSGLLLAVVIGFALTILAISEVRAVLKEILAELKQGREEVSKRLDALERTASYGSARE